MNVQGNLLELILQVAATEAVAAGFPEITTAHLLMALCRVSEAQADGAPGQEAWALRQELTELGIEPTPFRRRLRSLIGRRDGPRNVQGVLHRSSPCKAVFAQAAAVSPDIGEASALLRTVFLSLCDPRLDDGPRSAEMTFDDEIPWEI